jgi:ABC-2 type transport system ATP-binding protein
MGAPAGRPLWQRDFPTLAIPAGTRYTPPMQGIVVEGLVKTYSVFRKQEGVVAAIRSLLRRQKTEVRAVKGVSFRIEPGEMVAFLGPNGAGKTTTLKLLAGLIQPTAGTATVMGHVPWKRELAYRRRFALVMGQKNQLWWDLPAQESFLLHKEIYGLDEADFRSRLGELTELLEVTRLVGQPVRELSLGERMRMELIAALLHSPEVLFLDEPTIGLDVVSQRRVQEFLKQYQARQRLTVLLTSHYMKDVQALCERVIVINDGEIRHDGPLAGIIDRFGSFKIVDLLFSGKERPTGLESLGEVLEEQFPRIRLKIPRQKVPETLAALLARYELDDVGVQDRPLEEVIAELFTSTRGAG